MSVSYLKTKIACYIGYVVQAIVNNFLPILFIVFQKNYGLSYEKLGRIIFINFFVQIFADLATPKIVDLIGYRGAAIACQGMASLGLASLAVFPKIIPDTYTGIIISVVIYAFSSGIMEVALSPLIELLPTVNKAKNMAFLHSFYCWGQVFTVLGTTMLVFLIGYLNWIIIPLIWAIIPFVNMFMFMRVPIVEPERQQGQKSSESFFKTREFFCFAIFMLCAGASEMCMSQWASMFAQQGLGVSKVIGDLLGPCAFGVLMGSGRIIFGLISGKFSVRKVLIFNNVLCFVCYVTVSLCKLPLFALLACALCGFSVSLSWPGTYSLAAARFKNGGTLMFSIFALCGDFGCSSGPWLLGAAADKIGLEGGFLVGAAFPLIMFLTALFVLKEKDCKTE